MGPWVLLTFHTIFLMDVATTNSHNLTIKRVFFLKIDVYYIGAKTI